MKKIADHFSTRFKMAMMFILCFLVIMLWPILFVFCNHIWLSDFRATLLDELKRLYEENERNSLW